MPIISVTNQKGGVGKTTMLASLAQLLVEEGHSVCCVDLDPQRNLDMMAGPDVPIRLNDVDTPSMLQVMNGECSIQDCLIKTPLGDLARASSLLSGWNGQPLITRGEYAQLKDDPAQMVEFMASRYEQIETVPDTHVLKDRLKEISRNYQYIFLDTNPSLMLLTMNALYAADYVLIPAFTDDFSRNAIIELWNTIQSINYFGRQDDELKVAGIVVTKSNKRAIVAQTYYKNFEDRAEKMGTILFDTKIRQSVLASEATAAGRTVVDLAAGQEIAKDYKRFTKEFVKRIDELEAQKGRG